MNWLAKAQHRGKPAVPTYYLAAALTGIVGQMFDSSQVLTAVGVALLIRWAHTDRAPASASVGDRAVTVPTPRHGTAHAREREPSR